MIKQVADHITNATIFVIYGDKTEVDKFNKKYLPNAEEDSLPSASGFHGFVAELTADCGARSFVLYVEALPEFNMEAFAHEMFHLIIQLMCLMNGESKVTIKKHDEYPAYHFGKLFDTIITVILETIQKEEEKKMAKEAQNVSRV